MSGGPMWASAPTKEARIAPWAWVTGPMLEAATGYPKVGVKLWNRARRKDERLVHKQSGRIYLRGVREEGNRPFGRIQEVLQRCLRKKRTQARKGKSLPTQRGRGVWQKELCCVWVESNSFAGQIGQDHKRHSVTLAQTINNGLEIASAIYVSLVGA